MTTTDKITFWFSITFLKIALEVMNYFTKNDTTLNIRNFIFTLWKLCDLSVSWLNKDPCGMSEHLCPWGRISDQQHLCLLLMEQDPIKTSKYTYYNNCWVRCLHDWHIWLSDCSLHQSPVNCYKNFKLTIQFFKDNCFSMTQPLKVRTKCTITTQQWFLLLVTRLCN